MPCSEENKNKIKNTFYAEGNLGLKLAIMFRPVILSQQKREKK